MRKRGVSIPGAFFTAACLHLLAAGCQPAGLWMDRRPHCSMCPRACVSVPAEVPASAVAPSGATGTVPQYVTYSVVHSEEIPPPPPGIVLYGPLPFEP